MPYMLNLQNLLRGWADALLAWLGVTPVHNDAWDRWVAFLLVVFVAVLFDFSAAGSCSAACGTSCGAPR